MENIQKVKRRRVNPTHRWTEGEKRKLVEAALDAIKGNPENFEKPTAQRFYEKIAIKASLPNLTWIVMKCKMRHMKQSFIDALKWKSQNGADLEENGDESSVQEYVNKICPHFDLMHQLFGQRKSVVYALCSDTTNDVNEFSDDVSSMLESVSNDDNVTKHHRWNEEETIKLLKCISKMLKHPNAEFERPTARIFYEKMKQTYFAECNLSFEVIKNKMRYLKSSYMKAVEWKDNVGMQLYDSDQKHVHSRIRSICPHYNLLDEIFGAISNSDPIGFRLPPRDYGDGDDEETTFSAYTKQTTKTRQKAELTEALLVPKTETLNNTHSDNTSINDEDNVDDGDETLDTMNEEYEASLNGVRQIQSNKTFVANYESQQKNNTTSKDNKTKRLKLSLDERKFELERQKFHADCRLQWRRQNLEERNLQFKREKFESVQNLRKYEIDKQYAIKKQEIESNERLKRMELRKSTEQSTTAIEDMNMII